MCIFVMYNCLYFSTVLQTLRYVAGPSIALILTTSYCAHWTAQRVKKLCQILINFCNNFDSSAPLSSFCRCRDYKWSGARREYLVWGGAWAPGMVSAGAQAYNVGVQGQSPWSGGLCPPEAENLLASGCATEAANLPHSVRTCLNSYVAELRPSCLGG